MRNCIALAVLLMACQSDKNPSNHWTIDTFEISWMDSSLTVLSETGETVFASPEGTSALAWGMGEADVEYGSGSFEFGEDEVEWCSDAHLSFENGDEQSLVLTAKSITCDNEAELTISATDQGHMALTVEARPEFNRIQLTGRSHADERLLGFGAQASQLNMKGRELPIWCQEQGHGRGAEPLSSILEPREGNPAGEWHNSYTCVPWMFSDEGWGVLLENNERSVFDLVQDNRYAVTVESSEMNAQFIMGSDPTELISSATTLFGRMQSLPEWTQRGAIIRAHGGADSVLATAQEAVNSGTPVAGIWIEDWCGLRDTPLGSRMWWNWTVDRQKYPEWENLVAELDSMGLAALAYLNPYLTDAAEHDGAEENLFAYAEGQDFLVKNTDGTLFLMDQGGFEAALIDLSNTDAVEWLTDIVRSLAETGVKGWMADFAEGLPLGVTLANGEPEVWHNKWPEKWAEINDNALANMTPGEHFVFHRSGNQFSPGKARAFWAGDQTVTWDANDGIASVVPLLISSGLSGYTMQHADTGGYLSVDIVDVMPDGELFKRWVELNAMTPILRLHSTNQPELNHQWNSDADTIAHFRRFSNLYKDLAPTRSELMLEAEEKGWPLVRPLFFHYPNDSEAWDIADQFMLGPDLIMAPVVIQGATTRTLYLPNGEWIHGPSQVQYDGPQWIEIDAPIGSPAVFGRKGTPTATNLISLSEN